MLLERAPADAAGQEKHDPLLRLFALRLACAARGKRSTILPPSAPPLLQKHDGVQMHLLEGIAAYFYALQGQAGAGPGLFREHKLGEVSFFGPCRPMMSLIEQQVWLAQGST